MSRVCLSESRKAIFDEWKSIAAHDALGTITGKSFSEKASIVCIITLRALAKSPLLKAGCPQHVWFLGNSTFAPYYFSTLTAHSAAASNIESQRHVAIKLTCLPFILSFGGVNIAD